MIWCLVSVVNSLFNKMCSKTLNTTEISTSYYTDKKQKNVCESQEVCTTLVSYGYLRLARVR